MKRSISILLAVMLACTLLAAAVLPASAKKKEFSYLSMTLDASLMGTDQYARWVIPWDEIFESGKEYTFFANVMFGDDCVHSGGSVYINMYAFDDLDSAMAGADFSHLVAWIDFAKWGTGAETPFNEWNEYTFTCNPCIRTYGSPSGEVVNVQAVWISIGFYLATGTVNVRELGVKDEDGKVIYSQSFEYGLDFDDAHFVHSGDITPDTEGETWKILTSEVKKEESSEPEPEPEPESSEEPEPEPESSEEPEPEPESSEEPEPEPESSEEPEPEPSEEPSEAAPEPSADEQPSQAEQASEPASEAPAESNGPGPVLWIILGAVAVAIAVAVVLILVLRKKKTA